MEKLLPDLVKELWARDGRGDAPPDALWHEEQRLLATYRAVWEEALRLAGHAGLKESLLAELGEYTGCGDAAETERRGRGAVQALKEEWHRRKLDAADRAGIEAFYDRTEAQVFELMWWHTLADDPSPLAYVVALEFAEQQGCARYLDFGSGVGSGGITFARHGFDVTLADISGALLRFSNWRFARRGLAARFLDLKTHRLAAARYDIVTAMDVWEHLVDPVAAVDQIAEAIAPGGFLFGRFGAEPDPERPQHIVSDFDPTFKRLAERGFVEVWRDEWLWGHQAFQRT
jgi:SAM-dependent methyltransferase